MIDVQLPGAVDDGAVLLDLRRRSSSAPRCGGDGHDVRGAVGEPEAGAGVGDLHHVPGEVAGRMVHALVRRGDVAAGGVVVGAEVRGHAAAARGVEQGAAGSRRRRSLRIDCVVSIMISSRSEPAGKAERRLQAIEEIGERGDLLRELPSAA